MTDYVKNKLNGKQLTPVTEEHEQIGTFADNKRTPIHRWFQYPAGFSPKAVEYIIKEHAIKSKNIVYDPFVGTGTTAVVCKNLGIECYGVEAHPFVHKIAVAKTSWDFSLPELLDITNRLLFELDISLHLSEKTDISSMPELVKKCFSESNLKTLVYIRNYIHNQLPSNKQLLFEVALICALREASAAATGWPYIAPKKRIEEKDGFECFKKKIYEMIDDLKTIPEERRKTPSHIILGDARDSHLPDSMVDLAFTSPPYLNNYDYADRTRLETYFNGYASTWGDITEKVRSRLIMSATTQINRSFFKEEDIVSQRLKSCNPKIATFVQDSVTELATKRLTKGGKKSYDILVGQYFNDMTEVLFDTFRLLKPKGVFVLILGDSAPYGVHIPTEDWLCQIGCSVGFKKFTLQQLRTRGDKWRGNTQRHHVALKESILTLFK